MWTRLSEYKQGIRLRAAGKPALPPLTLCGKSGLSAPRSNCGECAAAGEKECRHLSLTQGVNMGCERSPPQSHYNQRGEILAGKVGL